MKTPSSSKAYSRKNKAKRHLGKENKCSECGESMPLALIPDNTPRICAACQRRAQGKSVIDQHHPAGQNNHPGTVPVFVNDHRAFLSAAQNAWPKKTLENPDRSPLLVIAACIRGVIDFFEYCIDKFLRWIPEQLERLDEYLTEHFGDFKWEEVFDALKGYNNNGIQ